MAEQEHFRTSSQTWGLVLSACVGLALLTGGAVNAKEKDREQEGIDPGDLPQEMTTSLEDLLNDPEGVAPDREEQRCITRRNGLHTEILDAEHVLFRPPVGRKAWLNRLTPGCIGLRPEMILILEGRGGRVCQLDRVSGRSRLSRASVKSGVCSLGKFEPITELHAQALEDTFKLRSKEMAEARRQERLQKRTERRKERKARREARKTARVEEAS